MRSPAESGPTCAQARASARAVLAARGVAGQEADDVLLLVTELVSNARRHAGGVTALRISCGSGRAVVEVSDARQDLPHSRPTPAGVPGRFGWVVVHRIAERVTVRTGPAGKTITAVVAVHTGDGLRNAAPAGAGGRGVRAYANGQREAREEDRSGHVYGNGHGQAFGRERDAGRR
jgi:anti-sigma regulatory factor (Ser/Thr protein kinase)